MSIAQRAERFAHDQQRVLLDVDDALVADTQLSVEALTSTSSATVSSRRPGRTST